MSELNYDLKGGWYVAKLRLVVGPDLLKERGLMPPDSDKRRRRDGELSCHPVTRKRALEVL